MKETVICVDCSAERKVTKACLKLVKRCKPCQVIFNRNQARNRYRNIHGISIDDPVKKPQKKKKNKDLKVESQWLRPVKKNEPTKPSPERPIEKTESKAVLAKLINLLGDDSTEDDW